MFEQNGVYRIRGIVSLTTAASDTNNCSSQSYVVFTDIARYLDWIQEVVPRVETFLVKSGKRPINAYLI